MSKKSKRVAESTLDAKTIVDAFIERPALLNEVMEQMQLLMTAMSEQKQAQTEWYRVFESEFTTITVKEKTVQVKVERGHASEFKAQLRAAGFRWGNNIRAYWAWLDDEKRAEVARRNAENDALTEGMNYEQRKAFWAERKARKSA